MRSIVVTIVKNYFVLFLLFTVFCVKAQTDDDKEKIFSVAEVQAEFPGGLPAMHSFVAKELRYPMDAQRANIQGKVFVQFIIGKDGAVEPESVNVIKGVSTSIDKEAIRVVKLFPVWTPGYLNSKPIRSRFVLPINFKPDGKSTPGYDMWFHGTITRHDNTTSRGEINHDLKTETFQFRNKDQNITLTPRTINSFDYQDESRGVLIRYVTLEFTDLETGIKGPAFFELLTEFPFFALISNKAIQDKRPETLPQETIYILDQDGHINPYRTVANDGSEALMPIDNNNSDDALKSHVKKTMWPDLRQYANEQNLSFEKKSDLLKILYYYSSLLR